jgi:tetratricopeptide (TPR) repeat protein
MELGGQKLALSPVEMARLSDVGQTLSASRAFQDRALAAARAVANSPDARYVLALYQLEIGQRRRDGGLMLEALDVLIPHRATKPERLGDYLGLRGDIAFRAGDLATASAMWTRLAEMRPNDPQALVNLAQVRGAQQDAAGAIELMRRAIEALGRESGKAPEGWHRQRLSIAFNGGMTEQTAAAAHALIAAYPTTENWRIALATYRQLAMPQGMAEIDLLRLMRAAAAFSTAAEYQRLAQLLMHAGLLAEARAALDDGLTRGIVSRTASPTPEILGEMDRALTRPPARSLSPAGQATTGAAANLRRGAALAVAGNRSEAETSLRMAAGNDGDAPRDRFYADLARFWLAWLTLPQVAAATR